MKNLLFFTCAVWLFIAFVTVGSYAETNETHNKNLANSPNATKRSIHVPEPASLILLGTGLLGISLKISQRKKIRRD